MEEKKRKEEEEKKKKEVEEKKLTELVINQKYFKDMVERVALEMLHEKIHFEDDAVKALQESAESYMVSMFEETASIAENCHRQTIKCDDIKLFKRIKKIDEINNV